VFDFEFTLGLISRLVHHASLLLKILKWRECWTVTLDAVKQLATVGDPLIEFRM
jgi:hypothetical protein